METDRAIAAEESVFIEDYLTWLNERKSRSPSTIDSYRKDLLQLSEQLSGCCRSDSGLPPVPEQLDLPVVGADEYFIVVTPQAAQNYVDWLTDQRFSSSTVNRKITSIRGFFNHLKSRGRVNSNPFTNVYIPQHDLRRPEFLDEDQLGQLFGSISCDCWLGYRDRAIVALLYNTGMRVSELLELAVDDIDEAAGVARIHSAGRKTRTCKLWGRVLEVVCGYLEQRRQRISDKASQTDQMFINRDGGPLTARSVRRKLILYSQQAKIGLEVTPAILRHSCAIHMLQRGASDRAVRRQLGHQSNSSIRPYLKMMKELDMPRGHAESVCELDIALTVNP